MIRFRKIYINSLSINYSSETIKQLNSFIIYNILFYIIFLSYHTISEVMKQSQNFNDTYLEYEQNNEIQTKNKIYESKYQISLQQIGQAHRRVPEPIVLSVQVAFNQSFVLQVGLRKIQHYSYNGHLLKQLDTNSFIKFMFTADPKTVMIVTESHFQIEQCGEIIEWNLQNYQTKTHYFQNQGKITQIQVFKESKLICICEKKVIKSPTKQRFMRQKIISQSFKIIYYQYPLSASKIQVLEPINVLTFNSHEYQLNLNLKLLKLNEYSMVGLVPQIFSPKSTLQIIVNDLESQTKWRVFKFDVKVKQKIQIDYYRISEMFEIRKNIFYIKTQVKYNSAKVQTAFGKQIKNFQPPSSQWQFIWDYKTKNIKKFHQNLKSIHQTQFLGFYRNLNMFKQQLNNQLPYRENSYDQYKELKGVYDRLWTKAYSSNYIFYIDPLTQQILTSEKKQMKLLTRRDTIQGSLMKISTSSFDHNIFIEYYEEIDKMRDIYKVHINVKKVKQLLFSRDIAMTFFAMELIEGCDEDLMYEMAHIVDREDNVEWGSFF